MRTPAQLQPIDAALRDAGVTYYSAREILTMGAAHYSGEATNQECPQALIPNLIEVAKLAQGLRAELGRPIRITSAFRSSGYNRAVGGSGNSYHKQGKALDLMPKDPRDLPRLIAIAKRQHAAKQLHGGLGIYQTFIHIDTGPHRDF